MNSPVAEYKHLEQQAEATYRMMERTSSDPHDKEEWINAFMLGTSATHLPQAPAAELGALVGRLEKRVETSAGYFLDFTEKTLATEAIATLRALAGELTEYKEADPIRIEREHAQRDELISLQAENTKLAGLLAEARREVEESREESRVLRQQMDGKIEDFLNERYCCNGQDCGCMGVSRLEQYVSEEVGTQLTALRAEVKRLMESETYWEKAATQERDQRQKEIGMQEYRGNTISYIYDKERTYGAKFDEMRAQLTTAQQLLREARDGERALSVALEKINKRAYESMHDFSQLLSDPPKNPMAWYAVAVSEPALAAHQARLAAKGNAL